jgi:hypothetical protein
MRELEQGIAKLRAAWRRLSARCGGRAANTVRPARLVLRLDDGDLPGSLGAHGAHSPSDWRRALVSMVDWLGPLPVTIYALRSGATDELEELIRFAHRLECEVTLVTDGTGIDTPRAEQLIDRGLARVRVLVGGVSDEVQRDVVGNSAVDATTAVLSFIFARKDRGAPLDVEIDLPWQGQANREARAVVGWARQVGADGFRVVAPWKAGAIPDDDAVLGTLALESGPFQRTPAATFSELKVMRAHADGLPGMPRAAAPARRRLQPCPVGGQRLEITANGAIRSCPFKPDFGPVGRDASARWREAASPHLAAIRACDRACAHVELAPAPLLG